jgi:hypothetical protein
MSITPLVMILAQDPAAAPPQAPPPASAPVFIRSIGLELAHGKELPWFAQVSFRFAWMPAPWVGLSADAYPGFILPLFPAALAMGLRMGPMLRWPLGRGPLSPFASAQAGVVGFLLSGARAAGSVSAEIGRELSVEAGADIPLTTAAEDRPSALFLSVSGRGGRMNFDGFDVRFWSARLALGRGF